MKPLHLLLLHGLAGGPEDWCAVLPHLPGARAVTPRIDYPAAAAKGLEALAAAIFRALPPWFDAARGLVAGNSLGASLALVLGSRFRRLVLVAPHLATGQGRLDRGEQTVHRELGRVFSDPSRLQALQVRGYEALWRRASGSRQGLRQLRQLKRGIAAFPFEQHLGYQTQKTLLICGRDDGLTPLPQALELARRHPGLRLEVLERCGHAVPLERPRALAALLSGCGERLHPAGLQAEHGCLRRRAAGLMSGLPGGVAAGPDSVGQGRGIALDGARLCPA